jgi:thioester reductase-like protein
VLLERASEETLNWGKPLCAVAVRLGQVTGTSGNGAWNTAEYIPILLKSSIYMGCLPEMDAVRNFMLLPILYN